MNSIRPTQAYIDENRAAQLLEKWAPVLDYTSKSVAAIEDSHTRLNTAMLLKIKSHGALMKLVKTIQTGPKYCR
jgi:transposase